MRLTRDQWISLWVYVGCLAAVALIIAWGVWTS